MPAEPEFWHPKDAANYLNIHVSTLYEWVGSTKYKNLKEKGSVLAGPKPPFYRFGRNCIRFPVKKFKAWTERFFIDNQKGK